MLDGWSILKVVGKALVVRGGKFLLNAVSGGVLGEAVDVVQYAWEEWQKATTTEEAHQASLQALAQAPIQEVRRHAYQIVQEVAADQPEAVRQNLVNYLTHVPATIRRSLRRASDPSGTTIPAGLVLRKADDLLALLPPRLPRFKEGDFPLANVDLELVELLGVGGFGEVWKARNPHAPGLPPVALKFCLDPTAASSLRHEVALLSRVMQQGRHDGIVKLLDTYLGADPPCLKYEYIAGGDLGGLIQEWHRTAGGIRPEKAAKVMLRLTEIVGFAHRLNPPIVHRDLKPANILVQKKDKGIVFKVADFGIGGVAISQAVAEKQGEATRLLAAATVARGSYTALYASPQQMAGLPADPRDDVYALGVIWYHLLTGDLAKGVGVDYAEDLREAGVDGRMIALLGQCVAAKSERRPADARTLADQLTTLLNPASPTAAASVPKPKKSSPPPNVPVLPSAIQAGNPSGGIQELIQSVQNILEQHQLRRAERDAPAGQDAPPAITPRKGEHKPDQRTPSASREKVKGTLEAKEVLRLEEPGVAEVFGRFATAVFSPDQKYILSACGTILLWDFPGGKVIGELKLPPQAVACMTQPVASLAFSPDGRQALTGGSDGILRLWDVRSGTEIRTFGGGWFEKKVPINSVTFCPKGKFALVGGDDPYMRMWDVASNKLARKFEEGVVNTGLAGFGQPGMDFQMASVWKGVAVSPDGRHAASAGDAVRRASGRYVAVVWDVQSGHRLRPLEGHEGIINCVVFSPDGRHVLSGSEDKTVRLWDITSGKEIRRFEGHPAPVHAVAFSPDGRFAVSGNGLGLGLSPKEKAPSVVRGWRVETGEKVFELVGHTGQVRSVCFSPDGHCVLTAGSDKTIRVWAIQGL